MEQDSGSPLPPLLDVLIVGAGLSGTTAAYTLLAQQPGLQLRLVEADAVVGGRTRNWNTGDDAIELGGTWVSPNHTALLQLCRTLDVDVFRASWVVEETSKVKVPDKADATTATDHRDFPWWFWGSDFARDEYGKQGHTIFHSSRGKFAFNCPTTLIQAMDEQVLSELQMAGDFIQEMTDSTLPDLCWDAKKPGPGWSKWDAYTTAAAVFPHLTSAESRNILRNVIHDKNAQEPSSVGFLYNLISFRGCNSHGPDTEYRIRGGSQAVASALANRLGKERVILGDGVQSIVRTTRLNSTDMFCITLQSGRVLLSRTVIVTGSPPAVLGIHFHPPLPNVHAQLLQRMPMGTSRKVIAIYKRPWWRQDYNLSGDILASSLPPHLCVPGSRDQQPIFGQCFDTTPFSHSYGALTCFVEGRVNLYFSSLDKGEQERLFLDFLKHSFGDLVQGNDVWKPNQIVQYNWADNPHVRGAYTAYLPTGVISSVEFWDAFRTVEKLPNVWLAGSDYQVGYGCGYMEGAVRSGQRVAGLVKERLREINDHVVAHDL